MQKQHQAGFHITLILLVVAVVGVAGLIGYRLISTHDVARDEQDAPRQQARPAPENGFAAQYKDACKPRDVTFTSGPMPADQLAYIEPLGKVGDGHVTPTDHVYVHPPDMNAGDVYDAVMPADGTVVEIAAMPSQYVGDRDIQTSPEDHRLVVAHNCELYSIFIHIHKLAPKLADAVKGLQPNQSKRVSLELKAGDKLGKVGGHGYDWTSVDTTKQLSGFITPDNYKGESWKIHTVSPFDMYEGALKQELEAKSLRARAPLGGKIDWDQPGKLIGNWFREGSGGYAGTNNNQGRYWDAHLSIAPDFIDGVTTIVSIGNWEGKAAQLVAKGGFKPETVTPANGPVKVELARISYVLPDGSPWYGGAPVKGMTANATGETLGTIMFEVQKGERLKVEKFVGKTAAQVHGFTAEAQTYTR
ncbi:hypothetical protein JNJ66_01295 [Candidatus Saccharibacteria bacterium]|nr:hypothetical protein [Candidatus Saccharibacteria bacterium]